MNLKTIILIILLVASPAMAKDVDLEWDHSCVNATGFHVYRSQGSAHWPELLGSVDCPTTEFTDLNVPYGDLSWIVTAYGNGGESSPSNEVEFAYYYGIILNDKDASGRLLYRGENPNRTAATSETTWTITKYFYDETGFLYKMETRVNMSWTNRATGW